MNCDICDAYTEVSYSPYDYETHCQDCEHAVHSSVDDINLEWDDEDAAAYREEYMNN